jgi:hypoxanthine phosphoribosyltransferase
LIIKDKTFEPYISEEQIQEAVKRLATKINADYSGKELFFLGVLNGSFMFCADLLKEVTLPCEISFVKVASYEGTGSKGHVDELIGLVSDLKGKDVIILEDIVDTGLTLQKIYSMIDHDEPKSLEVATLLFKPDAFQGVKAPKYIGLEIPDNFVVGYGLDYDGFGRNSSTILKLKNS